MPPWIVSDWNATAPDGNAKNEEEAVLNTLMEVIKPAGAMGIPGVYTNLDPGAPNEFNKKGFMALGFPGAWVKSPSFTAGQCPVMHYNRELMMAILWGRMPYLTGLFNTEVAPLEKQWKRIRASMMDPPRNT